jgi:prepilin-type N-terminal cleavage/methylation domain-containing protein
MRNKTRTQLDKAGALFFTLIELLVVIAIIGILASMLLPSLQKAREQGKAIACMGMFKQVGLGTYMYVDDFDGYLPSKDYFIALIPYMGTDYGIDEFSGEPSTYVNRNLHASKYFVCPSETGQFANSSYSSYPVAYSLLPTLTSISTGDSYYNQSQYGGWMKTYSSAERGTSKKLMKVSDNSVLLLESFANKNYTSGLAAYCYLYAYAGYTRINYNYRSMYPNDAGSNFYHNQSSNYLYKDGSVKKHRMGFGFNVDWQPDPNYANR